MGRGQRNHKAIADSRLVSTPRATSFIRLYGQMIEASEIDCRIAGAKIQINELPQTPEEIKEIQDVVGIADDFAGQTSFEGTIEFADSADTTLELISHQPSRSLALSTVLAAEKTLLSDGYFAGNVETKVLSYPSETVPAMIWAEVVAPEIGHFSLMASGDDLSRALARLKEVVPAAQMPTIPAAASRPADWPTAAARGHDKPLDNHVLSSIRTNPGAPLEPVRELIAGEVAKAVTAGGSGRPADGVSRASFDEPESPAAPARPAYQSLETALVVARVGPEVVLEADLLTPKALEFLEKTTPGMPPDKVRELRLQICQQVLPQHVETLLVYVDACREIPADKLPEIRKNVDRAFDEQQLPKLMKEANAPNSMEYEKSLRARGMSLDRMRKMFFERGLAQEWMRKNVKTNEEIPHADLIAWYQNHLADYDFPAKARFEALTVKTGLKRSRQQAWEMLAEMGNEILAGRPFDEVAKRRSEGPTASAGGAFDWTSKGSLASATLDEAIFSLPVGQLSAIIEDGEQLHIVRVVERKDAGRVPFVDAQVGIRETLVDDRRREAADAYLEKIRQRTPVWTVFDDPAGSSAAPQFTAGRPPASTTR